MSPYPPGRRRNPFSNAGLRQTINLEYCFDLPQVILEWRLARSGQHCHAVFSAFAIPNRDSIPGEVHVLNAPAQGSIVSAVERLRFCQPEARTWGRPGAKPYIQPSSYPVSYIATTFSGGPTTWML